MKKINFIPLFTFLILIIGIYISFHQQLPQYKPNQKIDLDQFSTDRALVHLKEISQKPHYVGTDEHTLVRNYLVTQLQQLGLKVEVQEREVFYGKFNTASKVYNILTKIEGTHQGKALMLLTHYDSAPHSQSLGASDAGSGVVSILESVRAYLHSGNKPKNDVIICFSDAEEIGLLGAKAFVEHHPWAKQVGLVINLEARGSGGPSYMLIETNAGNENLIRSYNEAKLQHPVGNSLMYSVYKMLPNDTDLTIFREIGNINGFNFAFIDDHFDYHTAQDSYERLNPNTLTHQGEYTLTLLKHFADTDLSSLNAKNDHVFFNFPFIGTLHYPFSWVLPFTFIAMGVFIFLFIMGIKNRKINLKASLRGFFPLLLSLLFAIVFGLFGWKLILFLKPEYKEILHGFTYNGWLFIIGFVALTIGVFIKVYQPFFRTKTLTDLLFAPIFLWLIINLVVGYKLPGAGFFIIPAFSLLITYAIMIFSHKIEDRKIILFSLIALPSVMIFSPLIVMFPVGLGLKMLVTTTVMTTLALTTLLSIFDFYKNHKSLILLSISIGVLSITSALVQSKFTVDNRQPNSILFYQDTATKDAYWLSYDKQTDAFTKNFITQPSKEEKLELPFNSKYNSPITLAQKTEPKNLILPEIIKTIDTSFTDKTIYHYLIKNKRNSNIYYLMSKQQLYIKKLIVNKIHYDLKNDTNTVAHIDIKKKLFSYYFASGVDSLQIELHLPKNTQPQLDLYDISLDLTENPTFSIPKRYNTMMPKPFVVTDAVILRIDL